MRIRTDTVDLISLRLTSGESRRFELGIPVDQLELAGERYAVTPALVPAQLDVSRMTGQGHALRLRFAAGLEGPCMRCLQAATPEFEVDAREISQPEEGEELESPYVDSGMLDVSAWARDALVLTLPVTILCDPGCAGLCPVCGEDLRTAGGAHQHDPEPDPRWAKLAELQFEHDPATE
jgi:uncharacterized protein